ncbi:hypothetical protein [Pseudoteredinibacter isoporae]|uniref:hypothetical protein n=1 Tax=Pseudoteredinibacter isoporae TaxID=570281 RepID=UPI00334019A6
MSFIVKLNSKGMIMIRDLNINEMEQVSGGSINGHNDPISLSANALPLSMRVAVAIPMAQRYGPKVGFNILLGGGKSSNPTAPNVNTATQTNSAVGTAACGPGGFTVSTTTSTQNSSGGQTSSSSTSVSCSGGKSGGSSD